MARLRTWQLFAICVLVWGTTWHAITYQISGLAPERIVALLGEGAVPFSEVSTHRSTLEEAYMELTRESVEFSAATPDERTP